MRHGVLGCSGFGPICKAASQFLTHSAMALDDTQELLSEVQEAEPLATCIGRLFDLASGRSLLCELCL